VYVKSADRQNVTKDVLADDIERVKDLKTGAIEAQLMRERMLADEY